MWQNYLDEISVKSKMNSISSTPFVNDDDRKLNDLSRPRRFYIDDILSSDFGHRELVEHELVSVCENQWTVADTAAAAANPRDDPNIAIQLINGTPSEFDRPTRSSARPRTELSLQAPTSFSLTSSRCFHDNAISADGSRRRTAWKDDVTPKRCNSTEAIANSDRAGSISNVTSSTTSHPGQLTRKPGCKTDSKNSFALPAWVYCTRYSDRPSAGPRIRRRPVGDGARRRRRRTAFSVDQLRQLRAEYEHSQYISDQRRQQLAQRIGLGVGTVKIWFQNRRASDKKASGVRNELALRLMAEGLYEHHTVNNNNNTTTSAL